MLMRYIIENKRFGPGSDWSGQRGGERSESVW